MSDEENDLSAPLPAECIQARVVQDGETDDTMSAVFSDPDYPMDVQPATVVVYDPDVAADVESAATALSYVSSFGSIRKCNNMVCIETPSLDAALKVYGLLRCGHADTAVIIAGTYVSVVVQDSVRVMSDRRAVVVPVSR